MAESAVNPPAHALVSASIHALVQVYAVERATSTAAANWSPSGRKSANEPAGTKGSVLEGSMSGGRETSSIKSNDTSRGSMEAGIAAAGKLRACPAPTDNVVVVPAAAAALEMVVVFELTTRAVLSHPTPKYPRSHSHAPPDASGATSSTSICTCRLRGAAAQVPRALHVKGA